MFRKPEISFFQFSFILLWVAVFLSCDPLSAQEHALENENPKDSIFDDYIIDYKKRFNVKLEVSNDITSYKFLSD